MQSSDTPGYQKVQTFEQPTQVDVNIQPTANISGPKISSEDIKEHEEENFWKELGLSVASSVILGASIKGIDAMRKKVKSGLHQELKIPDFSKTKTFDEGVRLMGKFQLQCEDARKTITENVDQFQSTKGDLTKSSQEQVNEMLLDINQQEYDAYKQFIERWSYAPEELPKMKERINKLQSMLDLKKSGAQIDQDIKLSDELTRDIEPYKDLIDASPIRLSEIPKEERDEIFKLRERRNAEKQKVMDERNQYYTRSNESIQNEIDELTQAVDTGGLKQPLRVWLDYIPEDGKYSKSKQGLIDYLYNNFTDLKQEIPNVFSQGIFRYNYLYGNDPELKQAVDEQTFHNQQKQITSAASKFAETLANKTKSIQDSINQTIEEMPQNIVNHVDIKPLIDLVKNVQDVKLPEITNAINQPLKKYSQKISSGLKSAEKVVGSNLFDLANKWTVDLSDDNVQNIKDLIGLGQQAMDQVDELTKFLDEVPQKYGSDELKIGKAIQDKFNSLQENLGKINKTLTGKLEQIGEISGKLYDWMNTSKLASIIPENVRGSISTALEMAQDITNQATKISRVFENLPEQLKNDKLGLVREVIGLGKKLLPKQVQGATDIIIPKLIDGLDKLFHAMDPDKWRYRPQASQKYLKGLDLNKPIMSYTDMKNTLSRDLLEQEERMNKYKEQYNIFFPENFKVLDPYQEKIFTMDDFVDQAIKPNEEERQTINSIREQQYNLMNDRKYLNYKQAIEDGIDMDAQIQDRRKQLDLIDTQIAGIDQEEKDSLKRLQSAIDKYNTSAGKELQEFKEKQKNQSKQIGEYNLKSQNLLDQIKGSKEFIKDRQESLDMVNKRISFLQPINTKAAKQEIKEKRRVKKQLEQELANEQVNLQKLLNDNNYNAVQSKNLEKAMLDDRKLKQSLVDNDARFQQNVLRTKQEITQRIQNERSKLLKQKEIHQQFLSDYGMKDNTYLNDFGEFIDKTKARDYINDTEKQLIELNNQLKQYEPQLNWMNAEKFNDPLTAAQSQMIEQTLHHKKAGPDGMINNAYIVTGKEIPEEISETKKKLSRKMYNPDKSYKWNKDKTEQLEKVGQEIEYNLDLQEELTDLYNEYYQKMSTSKTYMRPTIKSQYERAYKDILKMYVDSEQAQENVAPQMTIRELMEKKGVDQSLYKKQLEGVSKYYWNEHKNSKAQKYSDIQDIKEQIGNPKNRQTAFVAQKFIDLENFLDQPATKDSIKKFHQWQNKVDESGVMKFILPEKEEKQSWSDYIGESLPQRKIKKDQKYYYPHFNDTFSIETTNEVPIMNYLEDLGMDSFRQDDDRTRLSKQIKLITDDILPKYGGDNPQAQAWKDIITQNIKTIKQVVPTKINNTRQIQKWIKNLEYVGKLRQ